ncbi:AAA family ATPase [Roseateles cellulosilyticus]|uniref:AAA family ATPase n=1 Tax=Pelomonas cellulosilytica TaxID=2906762 RepID=A0ABS8Y0Y0_9BURK|nr:MoxR family ATPase [Pelomonas sp. P8]MCE4557948.1 AAA family ATPase [Pelomonas sp. P8]
MNVNEVDAVRHSAVEFRQGYARIRDEIARMVVGQADVIDGVLTALMAGGHVLLEGVPGLGKTMLVSSISKVLSLSFARIQFTPDMMPADIVGTTVLTETEGGRHELVFRQGPVVANLVLADEINRATPKTQSALLEVMQERQVTVGGRTLVMPRPFCVMATQNPVDQEGTYPLPEAQLDRFLFKLVVGYPREQDYHDIIDRTTSGHEIRLQSVSDAKALCDMQALVRLVPVTDAAKTYAIRLVMATQPGSPYAPDLVQRHVMLGASPRGVQGLMMAGKVKALLDGRYMVSSDDVAAVAADVLRHRVVPNFGARASGVDAEQLVAAAMAAVKLPHASA